MLNASTAASVADGSAARADGPRPLQPPSSPTRTTQHSEPPFWKKPYTLCARKAPSMNGPLSGSLGSP